MNRIGKQYILAALIAVFLISLPWNTLRAYEKKKPLVFRTAEETLPPLVLQSTLDLQLLEAFMLMQKANAGESPAQHELGIRYMLGRGFPIDTEKAAYWVQKAAEQHLPLAEFNYGIFLMNGLGKEWNPFKAYEYFDRAAQKELPEALYILGLLYTENFVVPRSWPVAYRYFRRAAELGSETALLSKKEIERRGFDTSEAKENGPLGKGKSKDSSDRAASGDTTLSLLFIDFHTDTVSSVPDTTLIREAYQGITALSDMETAVHIDSTAQSILLASADAGNPEALCLLGRCYEAGMNVRKDCILAGEFYLRALHLDSYRAPALLWKLMCSDEFERELEIRASKNDPGALYVWSGITAVGFSKVLNEKQALDLLQRAASAGHIPAMIELGSWYFTGRATQKDRQKAADLWSRASTRGNIEADTRIAAANVLGQIHTQEIEPAFSVLRNTAAQGSLFSTLTLAYCYEQGLSVAQDRGNAYRLFHRALQRGSQAAFHAIRRMHDAIRPQEKKFSIDD